jgi:2-dehydropantoate 2-reductase
MRYVIYGAGAVGGVIGGRLFEHGHDVVLIARGAHLDALRDRGLELQSPDGTVTLPVPVAAGPHQVELGAGDVVVLAMKSQDTGAAVEDLAAISDQVPVVCAQNGVENERVALRRFRAVYGMSVFLPATHLAPGVVQANGSPMSGILDLGRYPSGTDGLAETVARDLEGSRFSSRAIDAIMRNKYAKLLLNLGNALEAACGPIGRESELFDRAQAEAMSCFRAAGIDVAPPEEAEQRRSNIMRLRPVGGQRRGGGSTWQSLARGTRRIEADYLNGEVVLLGRLHGIDTPVNEVLQRVANRLARQERPPESMSLEELIAELALAEAAG